LVDDSGGVEKYKQIEQPVGQSQKIMQLMKIKLFFVPAPLRETDWTPRIALTAAQSVRVLFPSGDDAGNRKRNK